MNKQDYLIKAMAFNNEASIYAVTSTNTVKQITTLHKSYPAVSAALGRITSIGILMGAMLKGDQKLTINVVGDGPAGKFVVDVQANLDVRAYVDNPLAHSESYISGTKDKVGKLNVAGVVGKNGYIQVIKDIGLKDFFVGQTEIVSGEIAEDFTYYFAKSEQINSVIAAGVLVESNNEVSSSGAYIIQLLPNASEETICQIEEILKTLPPISELIHNGKTPEEIIYLINSDAKILEKLPTKFTCTCSKERFRTGIMSLGISEIAEMIEDGEAIETHCHFCNSRYMFEIDELKNMIREIEGI